MAHATAASQLRKVKKPLIERRRRERINDYLNELMHLVHEATGTNNAKSSSKMEKAEILEMTVEYLRNLRRSNRSSPYQCRRPTPLTPPQCSPTSSIGSRPEEAPLMMRSSTGADDSNSPMNHGTGSCYPPYEYVSGFSECARQVRRFLLREQHQQTGNSIEIGNATTTTPNGAFPAASLVLWQQLSEHVAARMRQQPVFTAVADDPWSTMMSQSLCRSAEVRSTPDFVTSPPPTPNFSNGFFADDCTALQSPLSRLASHRLNVDVLRAETNGSISGAVPDLRPRLMSSSSETNSLPRGCYEVSSAGPREERSYDVIKQDSTAAWPSSVLFDDVTSGSSALSMVDDRLPGSDTDGGGKHAADDSQRVWRPWGLAVDGNGNYLQHVTA